MNSSALFVAVFLACAVEAVEALTIVLAAGVGRDWRSALLGAGCSLTVLVLIVAALGPFTLAFKGVLLEGLEVVFIALTFGANQRNIPLAAFAALSAVVVVVLAGIAVRAPLARVPENSVKFIVGVMLTSFGIFWGAEGAGAQWPGADAALLALVPAVAVFALALVALLRRTPSGSSSTRPVTAEAGPS